MKVKKDEPSFQKVHITLETEEERMIFMSVLRVIFTEHSVWKLMINRIKASDLCPLDPEASFLDFINVLYKL